jgi:PHP domain
MEEIIVNLHMHTPYSDGHSRHAEIAQAAMNAGIDAVIVTDHNVFVSGVEGYFQHGDRQALVLVGEEIHDNTRQPQKNHMLVFGAGRDLSMFASDPQRLIDQVNQSGGLSFLAHPFEDSLPAFGEDDISWVDWQVQDYTGIELWNGFSEIKTVSHNTLQAVFYAFFPRYLAHRPLPRTLAKWDALIASGKKVVAVGGSDAHALQMHLGPIRKTVFPYEYHFRSINTHVLIPTPLTGEAANDGRMIIDALRQGHAFVGNDLPYPTRGFRFNVQSKDGAAGMGDEVSGRAGATFQIRLPDKADCTLLRDGQPVKTWCDKEICTHIASQPGVYRVEVYLNYLGKRRGWIFSNPIYLRP